jgi:hypothetical protein
MFPQAGEQTWGPLVLLLFICSHFIIELQRLLSKTMIMPLIVFQYWALYPILQKTFWHYLCKNIMFPQAKEKTQSPLLLLLFIFSHFIIELQWHPCKANIMPLIVFQYWGLNPIVQKNFLALFM